MTKRDKWKRRLCVLKYMAFKDECRLKKVAFTTGQSIRFHVPIPKSRAKSLKKGDPHKQRPDLDNYLKALLDALYVDDAEIWRIGSLEKVWTDGPGAIEIYWK